MEAGNNNLFYYDVDNDDNDNILLLMTLRSHPGSYNDHAEPELSCLHVSLTS